VNGVVTIVCLSLIVRSLLKGTPKKLNKSVIGTIAILALAIVVFAGIPGYSGFVLKSYAMSQQPGPIFGKEFREAFEWIRAETKPESVVAAWWDYGSAINELGRRATIIDDEQLRYWVHLMARHVMMAQTEDEALEFLKTHKATHLMLSYREIKNLWAISSIGSDRNYDRRSALITLYPTKKEKNILQFHSWSPISCPDEVTIGSRSYPKHSLILSDVFVTIKNENGQVSVQRPKVYAFHRKKKYELAPSEVFINGRSFSVDGASMPGCILLNVATASQDVERLRIASASYIPSIARTSLLVKLFLLGEEIPGFKLVYPKKEKTFSPVKIWKIIYPEDIKINQNYLSMEFPHREDFRP